MKTAGIVFSNVHDQLLPELTKVRTMASVPIAARYRMIDFVLSSMTNAGIEQVGIITKTKYHSLMEHVGAGKSWDLDRKNGGVTIISPFVEAGSGPLYTNRLEALQNSRRYVENTVADNILLSDSDLLANIPYDEILRYHEKSGADITAAYKRITFLRKRTKFSLEFMVGDDGALERVKSHEELQGTMNYGLNLYVIKRQVLLDMIDDSLVYGYKSFGREILPHYLGLVDVKTYEFKGYLRGIASLEDYWMGNMDLLQSSVRKELFEKEGSPVYTTVKDSAPTIYGEHSRVTNSLISDGCIIDGVVENSVLFRGVRVDEGAVVRNSVILQDNIIESGADLNYIVTEKNVFVRKGRTISGCEGYPFFISLGSVL